MPKFLENAAKAPKTAAKEVWLKSKEKAASEWKEAPLTGENAESSNDPANFATERMLSAGRETVQKSTSLTYRGGRKLAQTTARKFREHRLSTRIMKDGPVEIPSIRSKHMRKTIKSKVKGTVKTGKRAVKTSRNAVKTAQATARTAQKTAQATAKAAQRAVQAARAAAKAAVTSAKALAKAIAAAVKAAVAIVKSLVALIAAGGWVVIVIILVVALVAWILYSCYGIFFSGEDTGTGMTIQSAITEINEEYLETLETIQDQNPHDEVEVTGSRASWPEVLSVYAVKTTTTQEVATMDESKLELLRSVFWDFHSISHRVEEREVVQTPDTGSQEDSKPITEKVLLITISHRTAEELADQYGFTPAQDQQLAELLKPENRSLWSAALYGIGNGSANLVSVALSQVGNTGGEPYWSWYGFQNRVEWCACFVSWCADQCGYIDTGVLPKFASCTFEGVPWFRERGLWQDNTYTPNPGDIIFFNWDGDGLVDHVGIVERVESGRVYTIEGNSGDACRQNSYPLGYSRIYGYGILSTN